MLLLFLSSVGFNVLTFERVSPTCLQAPSGPHLVLDFVAPTAPGPRLSTPGDLPTEKPVRLRILCPALLDTLVAIEKEAASLVASVPPSVLWDRWTTCTPKILPCVKF